MNNFLQKIKKVFDKNKTEPLYVKKMVVPKKDWFISFSVFIILFVLTIVFSLYFYFQISLGNFFANNEQDVSERVLVINQNLLKKVTEDIDFRRLNRESGGGAIPSDPSI